ncbi:MAG: ABC transporter substrate-binding protein [Gloeomargaritaceae cyanobacterium C42_A2020_066]|nr:ABC transporter substrate-binding protein [Gloeomargaritaceae cyanobacterium C42_A2020_066]
MTHWTRRRFLITAGSSALVTAAGRSLAQTRSPEILISQALRVETKMARLGFIALTDASPLIIAKEKGFFDKYGMTDVQVLKQASWPVTRDNLELGSQGGGIDGAHILTPMPYLMTLGTITKGRKPVPMYILARLNTNGQGISIANEYRSLKVGLNSALMKSILDKARASGKELKVAMTFPGGTHDLWIRYWLAAGGIDPNRDVSVIPIPPPQMVANMKVGNMEAFCVGEPWNAQLVNQKQGYTALVTGELWRDHPEKALGLRKDWVDKNPQAAQALLMAVMEAQQWCEKPANRQEMCQIVSRDRWFRVPVNDILGRAQGTIDYGDGRVVKNFPYAMKFWANFASYPFKSHDLWFLTENKRWGYVPTSVNSVQVVNQVNREDLWRKAATALKVPAAQMPKGSSRGVEAFFNGVKFDPSQPDAYLKSLKIKKLAT